LFVCLLTYLKNSMSKLTKFSVHVLWGCRSSCSKDGVFPVLCVTLSFHIMGPLACGIGIGIVDVGGTMTQAVKIFNAFTRRCYIPGAEIAVCDCLVTSVTRVLFD